MELIARLKQLMATYGLGTIYIGLGLICNVTMIGRDKLHIVITRRVIAGKTMMTRYV